MSVYRYFCTWLLLSYSSCLLAQVNGVKTEKSVAILGESYSHENGFGFNQDVLAHLFTLIEQKQPTAVVFTGDMTLGLLKEKDALEPSKNSAIASLDLHALADNTWPRPGYRYDSLEFKNQIARFLEIKNKALGAEVPFYPIIARHEAFGPDSSEVVLRAFPTRKNILSQEPLIYSFSIERSLFIIFSIAAYDQVEKKTLDGVISNELLHTIDRTLEQERRNYEFVFVIGNQPAFSTRAVLGEPVGLDKNLASRDRFWDVLVKHRVSAYFCSLEHLYDRTNRFGIWQIISGGAGAPFYKRDFDKAFYHYLLLSLPHGERRYPKVQVFDTNGNVIDAFDLMPAEYPVYQLRVSYAS